MNFQDLLDEDKTDNELVSILAKDASSEALNALQARHAGIVTNVMHRFSRQAGISGSAIDDLLSDVPTVIFEAAKKFDASKSTKFSTWLWEAARFYTMNYSSRERRATRGRVEDSEYELENIPDKDPQPAELDKERLGLVIEQITKEEDPRVQKIFRLRYFGGSRKKMTYASIAEKVGLSRQGVLFLHDNFLKKCRKNIEKEEDFTCVGGQDCI